MKEKLRIYIVSSIVIYLMIASLINQQEVSYAILQAMRRCVYTVIPSIFANTVLTSVIAKTGIISAALSKITKHSKSIEYFILGNLGGYIIGASLLSEAVDRKDITKEEAENTLPFCYSPGPAFCVGVIGIGLFGNQMLGWMIYLINLLMNLLILMFSKEKLCKANKLYSNISVNTSEVIASVRLAANGMLMITAVTAIFAVIMSITLKYLSYVKLNAIIYLLDITTMLNENQLPFFVVCMLVSFGGLCILSQISGIIDNRFGKSKFYLSLLLKMPLSLIFGWMSQYIFDYFGISAITVNYSMQDSIIPIICITLMLYITMTKRNPDRFRSG